MTSVTDLREVVDVVIGVDTHAHSHSAAPQSPSTPAVLREITVRATADGNGELVELAGGHVALRAWPIAGPGALSVLCWLPRRPNAATDAEHQWFKFAHRAPDPPIPVLSFARPDARAASSIDRAAGWPGLIPDAQLWVRRRSPCWPVLLRERARAWSLCPAVVRLGEPRTQPSGLGRPQSTEPALRVVRLSIPPS